MAYYPEPIDTSHIRLAPELEQIIEVLARNSHELWARRRIAEGWRYGPARSDERRESPLLVPYEDLPESEREYDRENAREALKAILAMGGSIQPPGNKSDAAVRSVEQIRDRAARANSRGDSLSACDIAGEGLKRFPGDRRLRQIRALALARMGSHDEARRILTELRDEAGPDEETLGLLARTYKDLWLESRNPADLEQAFQSYAEAYSSHKDHFWTGINTATLAAARGDRETASRVASEVRAGALAQLVSASGTARYWLIGTIAEAALVLGEFDEAERRYTEAAAAANADLGNLATTLRNARILLRDAPDSLRARIERAIGMPQVAVFAGHRTDEPGRARPRFPLDSVPAVAEAIRARLVAGGIGVGYASAAAGGDILFLEALQDLGGRTHIVLPCSREQFFEESVEPCGADWAERFHRVLDRADEVLIASEERLALGSVAYDYANQVLYGLAVMRARRFGADLVRMAVWDGRPAEFAGGTAEIVGRWRSSWNAVEVIDPIDGRFRVEQPAPPSPPRAPAAASDFRPEIRAMIFADAYHFSKLGEEQVPAFIRGFIRPIAALVEESAIAPIFQNTWGDGLFFVFENTADAGRFALRLADCVAAMDRNALGLPDTIHLRIALHVGPVYRFMDRIIGKRNYIGSHVNRTARIEPVTPPGQVYGTYAFAAITELDAPGEFRCDYVGRIPLAKSFGEFPMYRVRAV